MKKYCTFWILSLIIAHHTAWAYGGGGGSSTKPCSKPKFSDFNPVNNALVPDKSEFSFIASSATYPQSIKVSVKEFAVPLEITPKNSVYLVTGTLPELPKGSYARINITAEGPNKCKGSGGWLVKISD